MISPLKLAGNKLFSKLVSILINQGLHDTQTGFRAMSREAAENLKLMGIFNCSQEMILDLASKSFKIAEVPVDVRYFRDRESRLVKQPWMYTGKVMGVLAMKLVLIPWISEAILKVLAALSVFSMILIVAM